MQITSSYRNPFIHSEPGRASEYKMKCWAVRTAQHICAGRDPSLPPFVFLLIFSRQNVKAKFHAIFWDICSEIFWIEDDLPPLPLCLCLCSVTQSHRQTTEDRVNSIRTCKNPWKWNDSCCFLAVSIYFLPPSDPQRKIFLLWQILFVGERQTVAK